MLDAGLEHTTWVVKCSATTTHWPPGREGNGMGWCVTLACTLHLLHCRSSAARVTAGQSRKENGRAGLGLPTSLTAPVTDANGVTLDYGPNNIPPFQSEVRTDMKPLGSTRNKTFHPYLHR